MRKRSEVVKRRTVLEFKGKRERERERERERIENGMRQQKPQRTMARKRRWRRRTGAVMMVTSNRKKDSEDEGKAKTLTLHPSQL
jgi:hypothetical protein